MTHRFAIVSCFLLAAIPFAARADWQGKMTMTATGAAAPVTGKISAKGELMRVDMDVHGQATSAIVDYKVQRVTMLLHARKFVMQTALDPARFGACSAHDIDGCLAKRGFKATGAESVNGHPCKIYEADNAINGKPAHQKLWRPTDLKEVPFVKCSTTSGAHVTTLDVNEIADATLADSAFQAPSDYKALPSFAGGFGGGAPGMPNGAQMGAAGHPMQLPPGVKLPPGVNLPAGMSPPSH
jgi:hypothetical protein